MPTYNYLTATSGASVSWTNTANWSGGHDPTTGESTYLQNSSAVISVGLAGNADVLADLNIYDTFTGQVGEPAAYLEIQSSVINVGVKTGGSTGANGSPRINLNAGTTATNVTITSTSTSAADTYGEPVRILAVNASNVLNVLGGLVGVATLTPAEAATFGTINQTGGRLNAGPGLTWTTFQQSDGTALIQSSGTTLTQAGGTTEVRGTGTIATINVAGTLALNMRPASGTVATTLTLADGAVLDLTGNPSAIAVGTLATAAGATATVKRNAANPGHFSWTTLTQGAGSIIRFE